LSDLRLRPYRGSSQASHCGATASNLAAMKTTRAPSSVGQLSVLLESWRLHLEAANLSPRTVRGYTDDSTLFAAFPIDKGMPTAVASIKREQVEAFIAAELARTSPSSAATRYRSLQQFFRWLDEEGEIDSSPMAKMRKPIIPEQPVPVLPDADVKRLLDSCAGVTSVTGETPRSSACSWTRGCGLRAWRGCGTTLRTLTCRTSTCGGTWCG
jgi:integrase